MLTTPNFISNLILPTIPRLANLPASYFDLAAKGPWPSLNFIKTAEPTSDDFNGAFIHAFAQVGPRIDWPLPKNLLPFAACGSQYFAFDLNTKTLAIRYIDQDVDQWLTLAPDFDSFYHQLTYQAPALPESPDPQALVHALMIADAGSLPELFERIRAQADYQDWLLYTARRKEPAVKQAAAEEFAFAQKFMKMHLDPRHTAQIAQALTADN